MICMYQKKLLTSVGSFFFMLYIQIIHKNWIIACESQQNSVKNIKLYV